MASLLDSKLKATVAKAFKGRLTRGVLRRQSFTTMDSAGDLGTPTVTSFNFEGIQGSFSAYYKAQAEIPETDVSILVLQGSFKPATVITKQDQGNLIYLNTPWNKWYEIRKLLEVDPANASVKLQCYEVPTPT